MINENVIIVCKCGCPNLRRSDLLYTQVAGKSASRCPNHSTLKEGEIYEAIVTCADCPTVFITSIKTARTKIRCTECQTIHSKELIKESNRKLSIKRKLKTVEKKGKGAGTSIWDKPIGQEQPCLNIA